MVESFFPTFFAWQVKNNEIPCRKYSARTAYSTASSHRNNNDTTLFEQKWQILDLNDYANEKMTEIHM